jgi:hypothetical protein
MRTELPKNARKAHEKAKPNKPADAPAVRAEGSQRCRTAAVRHYPFAKDRSKIVESAAQIIKNASKTRQHAANHREVADQMLKMHTERVVCARHLAAGPDHGGCVELLNDLQLIPAPGNI